MGLPVGPQDQRETGNDTNPMHEKNTQISGGSVHSPMIISHDAHQALATPPSNYPSPGPSASLPLNQTPCCDASIQRTLSPGISSESSTDDSIFRVGLTNPDLIPAILDDSAASMSTSMHSSPDNTRQSPRQLVGCMVLNGTGSSWDILCQTHGTQKDSEK